LSIFAAFIGLPLNSSSLFEWRLITRNYTFLCNAVFLKLVSFSPTDL
jgi:hypothetical protein